MSIRIDPETGDIVTAGFVIGRRSRRRDLKSLQSDVFEKTFETGTYASYRVALIPFGRYEVGIHANYQGDRLVQYLLAAGLEGDTSWDDWTKEKEADSRMVYVEIFTESRIEPVAVSKIEDKATFPWGDASIYYDVKNGTYSLLVGYTPLV